MLILMLLPADDYYLWTFRLKTRKTFKFLFTKAKHLGFLVYIFSLICLFVQTRSTTPEGLRLKAEISNDVIFHWSRIKPPPNNGVVCGHGAELRSFIFGLWFYLFFPPVTKSQSQCFGMCANRGQWALAPTRKKKIVSRMRGAKRGRCLFFLFSCGTQVPFKQN